MLNPFAQRNLTGCQIQEREQCKFCSLHVVVRNARVDDTYFSFSIVFRSLFYDCFVISYSMPFATKKQLLFTLFQSS